MLTIYTEADVPSVKGLTFFITGANTGIGYEAARVIAANGGRVLLGCRDPDRAAEAVQRLNALHPQAEVESVALDLASLESVREAAAQVLEEERLDVLINNAGVMMPPKALTADGFESQFGINHLGHFALTGLLLPKLLQQNQARVVNVSSAAHRFGRIDFNDLQADNSYQAGARYGMSKLANLLFTFELDRRLRARDSNLMSLACHPGGADTELGRHLPKGMSALIRPLARLVINSPAEGALPTLRAATDAQAHGGDYYGPAGWFEIAHSARRVVPSLESRNTETAAKLWDISVQLTGVDPLS